MFNPAITTYVIFDVRNGNCKEIRDTLPVDKPHQDKQKPLCR